MRKLIPFLPGIFLSACAVRPQHCASPGTWVAPATLRPIPDPVPLAASAAVVLLGEQHDREPDHRWQLSTIRALYAANPSLVLGLEMFPRAAQPVLDRWVQGGLSEPAFLAQSDWKQVWGFPPELYLPIFRFARDHHIPMLALNVSRNLVHLVAQKGWAGVAAADREGVGDPAPPSAAYRASLTEVMSGHGGPKMTPEKMQHFIDAQLVWDRAMAEAIAAQKRRQPARLVVALTGAGHLEDRNGIPHQLDDLGIPARVFVPAHDACTPFSPGYADAVYVD